MVVPRSVRTSNFPTDRYQRIGYSTRRKLIDRRRNPYHVATAPSAVWFRNPAGTGVVDLQTQRNRNQRGIFDVALEDHAASSSRVLATGPRTIAQPALVARRFTRSDSASIRPP